jgi:hypothetical protein
VTGREKEIESKTEEEEGREGEKLPSAFAYIALI